MQILNLIKTQKIIFLIVFVVLFSFSAFGEELLPLNVEKSPQLSEESEIVVDLPQISNNLERGVDFNENEINTGNNEKETNSEDKSSSETIGQYNGLYTPLDNAETNNSEEDNYLLLEEIQKINYATDNQTESRLENESTSLETIGLNPCPNKEGNFACANIDEINNNSAKENSPVDNRVKNVSKQSFGEKIIESRIKEEQMEVWESIIVKEDVFVEGSNLIGVFNIESEKHFNEPITAFFELAVESKPSDIKIYWEEEGKNINFNYIDKNNNGLVDKVSWIVPHLSNQTFKIIIELSKINDENKFGIEINGLNVPQGNISNSIVSFNFSVFYWNISNLKCEFNLNDNKNNSLIKGGEMDYFIVLENGNYYWDMGCYDENDTGVRNSILGQFNLTMDYTPKIDFYLDNYSIREGEIADFFVNISLVGNVSASYSLLSGNGVILMNSTILTREVREKISYNYTLKGNYSAALELVVDGLRYNRTKIIEVKEIPKRDNELPIIILLEPEDEKTINISSLKFSYKASDNAKINNCTFNLYYYNKSSIGSLFYTKLNNQIENNGTVSINLSNLNEGEYSWEVECYDNSSNYGDRRRDFEIDLNRLSDVEKTSVLTKAGTVNASNNESSKEANRAGDLIIKINDFLIKEEKYGPEEKEAIKELGIDEELRLYKKKLLQMEIDLSHNLDYVADEQRREERRKEIVSEIEEISKKIPIEIEVIKSHEYYKNSLEFEIKEIIGEYIKSKGIVLNKNGISDMIKANSEIQGQMGVNTKVKQIEIEYGGGKEEKTLIIKRIELKNESFGSVIEAMPKEISESSKEIFFINEYQTIKEDSIFEIKVDKLKEGKIVYYINELVEPAEIEKTISIPFKEEISSNRLGAISGFASFIGGENVRGAGFYMGWAIFIFIAVLIITTAGNKIRIGKIKKNKETRQILVKLDSAGEDLKNGELENAKKSYLEVKKLYVGVPKDNKTFIYKEVEKIRTRINRKDMSQLIKEFIRACEEKRRDDARLVYSKIKMNYEEMNKKDKKKIYDRIKKYTKYL